MRKYRLTADTVRRLVLEKIAASGEEVFTYDMTK